MRFFGQEVSGAPSLPLGWRLARPRRPGRSHSREVRLSVCDSGLFVVDGSALRALSLRAPPGGLSVAQALDRYGGVEGCAWPFREEAHALAPDSGTGLLPLATLPAIDAALRAGRLSSEAEVLWLSVDVLRMLWLSRGADLETAAPLHVVADAHRATSTPSSNRTTARALFSGE